MGRIKVHVTLRPEAAADPAARARVRSQMEKLAGLTEINQKRFDRYGLLSGLVDEDKLALARAIDEVSSVEPDRVRGLAG